VIEFHDAVDQPKVERKTNLNNACATYHRFSVLNNPHFPYSGHDYRNPNLRYINNLRHIVFLFVNDVRANDQSGNPGEFEKIQVHRVRIHQRRFRWVHRVTHVH